MLHIVRSPPRKRLRPLRQSLGDGVYATPRAISTRSLHMEAGHGCPRNMRANNIDMTSFPAPKLGRFNRNFYSLPHLSSKAREGHPRVPLYSIASFSTLSFHPLRFDITYPLSAWLR